MKRVAAIILVILALGAAILSRFPYEERCRATGRTVDPTRRHCVDSTGYVQLREHVLFHTADGLVVVAVAGALAWGSWALRRRTRRARGGAR